MPDSSSPFPWTNEELNHRVRSAVRTYWASRSGQASKQQQTGATDTGARSEVTGGQHLDAFANLLCDLIREAGFAKKEVRFRTGVALPGFYRPMKKWDVVVVRNGRLCAAIELKSQVGPSFGNNINNRAEEALGNSVDLWRAFQEGTLGAHPPWLGYLFFLEEAPATTRPISIGRSAFAPEAIFQETSYTDRYRILCQRMVRERNYNGATLLLAPRSNDGAYREASPDLAIAPFLKALYGHLIGCT